MIAPEASPALSSTEAGTVTRVASVHNTSFLKKETNRPYLRCGADLSSRNL